MISQALISAGLESMLNWAFALDPEARARLEGFAGRSLRVTISGLAMHLVLRFDAERIKIDMDADSEVDAQISGPPLSLYRLMRDEDTKTLFSGDVQLQGDIEFIKKVKRLFDYLAIDWEEKLAQFIGDYPTHKLGNRVRDAQAWLQNTQAALSEDLSDYLQTEIDALPHPHELEIFYRQVDCLRDDIERCAARVQRLQQKLL